jgi:hypothetical protein
MYRDGTERELAGARITRDDFARLAEACRYDLGFPAAYEDWVALVTRLARAAQAEGDLVRDVRVDVAAFIAWCRHVQVQPGLVALRAYLVFLRRGPPVGSSC